MANRKTYPKEFKEQAVRLLQKNGNKSQVARELGVTSGMLARWEQQAMQDGEKAFPGKGKPQDEELYQLKKEVSRLKEENEILKKGNGYLHQAPSVRYLFIHQHRGQFSLLALLRTMQVSKSGYYTWRKQKECEKTKENKQLLKEIHKIHQASKQTYGSPRIHAHLKANGFKYGEKRIARLMRLNGIKPKWKKKFKITTDSRHSLPVANNKLNQDFKVTVPNQKWTADITYVWTKEGWLYLAVVLDLFSRRIVGWSMQANLSRKLVIGALQMATQTRHPPDGLLHHSDRGSQYASQDYQQLLDRAGMVCSMSRKGNCYDNAPTESFFATLKRELIHHRRYQSRIEAKEDIFQYIEVWYNRKRRHSSLGYLSPEEYEKVNQSLKIAA
ncbi:IS3 family transposase [Rhodocytophaga rosea]|uniref:IS3 family transposase n=1 Tax=Rhodocytophaga rosea TaxID=2704465 RepID=A0A6C0GFV8_9BACT|nr:IS3 family transposase [Rhodocytophaga rosea]QHT66941.1 IS3 family transposase [Rhodocytophaga rosea]QHT67392.1 IS3 family transposase [Rhodocytophaga rosea]